MTGEILQSDIKFEDSHGKAVRLGDNVIVELSPVKHTEFNPYDGSEGRSFYANSRKIYGKLHLRAGSGLYVIVKGIIVGDEFHDDDADLSEVKYFPIKIRKHEWYRIDEDAIKKYEKDKIINAFE